MAFSRQALQITARMLRRVCQALLSGNTTLREKGNKEMKNHKAVPELSATVEELINQIMKERHLSREDAEGACRLTLGKQEHFQRLKAAILWNLDREQRRGEKARLSYRVTDIDLLVNATGMEWESIFDEIFNMVDHFILFVNQSFSKSLDSPAMDEFGWREVALLKQFNLDYTKHFPSLASIACDILDSYPRPKESIRRMS